MVESTQLLAATFGDAGQASVAGRLPVLPPRQDGIPLIQEVQRSKTCYPISNLKYPIIAAVAERLWQVARSARHNPVLAIGRAEAWPSHPIGGVAHSTEEFCLPGCCQSIGRRSDRSPTVSQRAEIGSNTISQQGDLHPWLV